MWTKITAFFTLNKRCLICGEKLTTKTIYAKTHICRYCYRKLPFSYRRFQILDVSGLAIYNYQGIIKDSLLSLKANGDSEIAKLFLEPIKEYLKSEYFGYTLLPIPSTKTSNKNRGFNHVIEIYKSLDLPIDDVLIKKKEWKQSDQRFKNRFQVRNILTLNGEVSQKKKYLLVDDIVTTGETLKAAIQLLAKNGVHKVKILVIAKRQKSPSRARINT